MELIGYFFFTLISKYIDTKFFELSELVNERLASGILPVMMVFVTIYFMLSGMRMAMGDSSESMRDLVFRALRVVCIFCIVSASMIGTIPLQNSILGVRTDITNAFRSGPGGDIYAQIDSHLDTMALGLAVIDGVSTASDVGLSDSKGRALTLTLLGQASPPMVAGLLLLINELGLRIAIMLAPIFLTAFMFKRTEDMFYTWLRFMVGSMFALGVLSMCIGIMSELTVGFGVVLAGLKAALYAYGMSETGVGGNLPQVNESVMQAGFGFIMTAMLVMVPVIVNRFFGSDMASYISNSFAGNGVPPNSPQGLATPATPAAAVHPNGAAGAGQVPASVGAPNNAHQGVSTMSGSYAQAASTGLRGQAASSNPMVQSRQGMA